MRGSSFKSGCMSRRITTLSFCRRRTGVSAILGACLDTIYFIAAPRIIGSNWLSPQMILTRKTLAPFESIRWSTALQGHILHVRIPVYGKTVDLVNVYQYAVHTGPDSAETMRKIERVLHHLEKTLSSLPIRNMLLLGGDFNTTGTRDVKAFGPGVLISKNPHPDRRLLANLITTHRLTALNAWSRLSRTFTYEHENAQSQIDFFFAREAQIDGLARQAKPDTFFTFCGGVGVRGTIRSWSLFRPSIIKLPYLAPLTLTLEPPGTR